MNRRRVSLRDLESIGDVGCLEHVISIANEHFPHQLADGLFIFHEQDRFGAMQVSLRRRERFVDVAASSATGKWMVKVVPRACSLSTEMRPPLSATTP